MEGKYLIINSGSASHKHALYQGEQLVYSIYFEMVGIEYVAHETAGQVKKDLPVTEKIFKRSIDFTVVRLLENKIINSKKDITAIGVRVVAPGVFFLENRPINKEYIKNLKLALEKAPLHLSSVIEELKFTKKVLPDTPVIGVSDSVFHKNMPDVAKYYALPIDISRKLQIYKYGYHGLSVQSVMGQLQKRIGRVPERVVVCHLGGGASVTAVYNGKSLENSMGFTPVDGLIMATRVGTIDPGAVVYLSEKLGLRDGKMLDFFNKKCGLLGLSNGKSDDIRELLKFEKMGDISARLALDSYAYRVRKLIGQAAVTLGGIDTLIFAGTVGERSFPMRGRICFGLDFLGLKLDTEKNNSIDGIEAEIQSADSRVKILVLKTDEIKEIVRETARIAKNL
jgi:acetate kinase